VDDLKHFAAANWQLVGLKQLPPSAPDSSPSAERLNVAGQLAAAM
jgi:hypothetical protein